MSDIPLFILYGSATGNAESIAKDLASKCQNAIPSPFNKIVCCPGNDFKKCQSVWENAPPLDKARKYGLIFVTSTTGNGDSPENASRFLRYLKRSTTADSLPFKHIAFGVLALGDSNYDIFCGNGKAADKKLQECGGERVTSIGLADEATGLEEVVESWVDNIVPRLVNACLPKEIIEEEKKMDDSKSVLKSSTSSRPNVQSILNQRMGLVSTSINPISSISMGSRPNVQALLSLRNATLNSSKTDVATPSNDQSKNDEKIKSPSPLFILYGSATGNAEHIAKNLARKYNELLLKSNETCYFRDVVCCELDQYKKKCLSYWEDDGGLNSETGQKHGVLFISSTTGNGDAPENASKFVRLLKRKTTEKIFRHVAYAVLGLGDTNYDQFCETGKLIDRKVKELGGVRVQDVACADEGIGLEQVVDPWVENIFTILTKRCKGDVSLSVSTSLESNVEVKQVYAAAESSKELEHHHSDDNFESILNYSGVSVIKQLLPNDVTVIPFIGNDELPSIGSSLSSCQLLINEEENEIRKNSRSHSLSEIERLTISSASTTSLHYSADRPFLSTILGARYITNTNTHDIASSYALWDYLDEKSQNDKIMAAKKLIENNFPLHGSNENERNTFEKNGKRVIELTLSLPEDFTLEYQPGDSIGLNVENEASAVSFVLDMLRRQHGILPHQKLSVNAKDPITVERAISEHIDLCSPIKSKRLLFALSNFATDREEENVLRLLASKNPLGQSIFQRYIEQQRLNTVDILTLFPSCQSITLEGLLAILPGIPPRYYSISSSPLEQMDSLTVTFSVVDYLTPPLCTKDGKKLLRRVGGLATTYLEAICLPFLTNYVKDYSKSVLNRLIPIFPKPTVDFRLPVSLSTPIILIGPGTGVAPFIGFLKHRQAQLLAHDSTQAAKTISEGTWRGGFDIEEEVLKISSKDATGLIVGADYRSDCTHNTDSIYLYFGCRYSDHDWLYKSEMESLEKSGIMKLRVAFSRDQSHEKSYVQDKLRHDGEALMDLIHRGANIYICGDGNAMAKDVQNAITDIVAGSKFKTDSEAEVKAKVFLDGLKSQKKLLLDIWS